MLKFLTFLLAVFIATTAQASEATVSTYAISLKPLLEVAAEFFFASLLAAGSWAFSWFARKAKLEADNEVRRYLEHGLEKAISFARNKAIAAGSDFSTIHVRSKIIADAADYIIQHAPDALRRFGATPEAVKRMIEARLPPVNKPEA